MENQNLNSDFLNIVSILLALQNLQENRAQTKQNDVQVANDKQAKLLIDEIGAKFDEQNEEINRIINLAFVINDKTDKINEKIDRLEERLNE